MKTFNLIYIFLCLFITGLLFSSCDKESEGISSVVTYPVFTLVDGDYINVKVQAGGSFTDPGVTAKSGDEVLGVETQGNVNIQTPGFYTLTYVTNLTGDFPVTAIATRKVFVTNELMTEDLYSGTYQIVSATRANKMTITKLGDGYYKASDTWFQAKAVPVEFLDYGEPEGLSAIPGSSNYGNFSGTMSYDEATSTISFNFVIKGGVNDGVSWKTSWKKIS